MFYSVIFIPVYLKSKDDDDDGDEETYDEYTEVVTNVTYATLTPKDGYDNIFILMSFVYLLNSIYFFFLIFIYTFF